MIGVLLVTHGNLGAELIEQLAHIAGAQPAIEAFSVRDIDDLAATTDSIGARIDALEQGHGVIVMVDLVGCTHCKLANQAARGRNVRMVTGINLPMLIRIAQERKRQTPLDRAVTSGIEAGRKYISALPRMPLEVADP